MSYFATFSNNRCYFLFIRLDVRTHLRVHCEISSDVYLVNFGIKSDVELSEGIWRSSDIFLTPFWWIKDSAYLLYNIYIWQIHPLLNLLHIQNEKYTKVLTLDFTNLYTKYPTKPPVSTPEYTASTMIQVLLPLQSTILVIRYFSMWCHHKRIWED